MTKEELLDDFQKKIDAAGYQGVIIIVQGTQSSFRWVSMGLGQTLDVVGAVRDSLMKMFIDEKGVKP